MLSKIIPRSLTYKENLYKYAQNFKHVAWLDSQNEAGVSLGNHSTEEVLVALGAKSLLKISEGNSFGLLKEYLEDNKWAFGFLSYDLKNEIEPHLSSHNREELHFPDLCFFEPEVIIRIKKDQVEVLCHSQESLDKHLDEQAWGEEGHTNHQKQVCGEFKVNSRLSKQEYISKVTSIKDHINRGDVYEMNFCHEFFAEHAQINPYELHHDLVSYSPTPFSSFVRIDHHYILCASPERFIKRQGNYVVSQPIKGTARRGHTEVEDLQLKSSLYNSSKERSENIMIVDLVRNDLSQIAKDGSVHVEELCGLYTFSQVHQLISTVSCQVREKLTSVDLIKKCFPMGSMTGAPKVKAMELIEEKEASKRGVYSGSVGYFAPGGDFDFNVVIRSILYHAATQYLSFSVGGAITSHSDPQKEYEETLLKAKGMMRALGQKKYVEPVTET